MHWFWHISGQLGSFPGRQAAGTGRFHTCQWAVCLCLPCWNGGLVSTERGAGLGMEAASMPVEWDPPSSPTRGCDKEGTPRWL